VSYDLAICTPPIPSRDNEAWEVLDGLLKTEGPPPEALRELHDRLTAKYPCICTLSDDDVDDGVWSDGPLWNDFGNRAAHIGIVYSRVGEVLPFVVKTANALGLVVFDWAGPSIHRP
jgi:hypothetical protein